MDLLEKISTMLIKLESNYNTGDELEIYSIDEYYVTMTRAFLEIRRLRQEVKVLEDKLNA